MTEYHGEYREITIQEWDRKNRTWELKFCLLPHKCNETGKLLWLDYAYRGTRIHRYDWEFTTDHKWMSKEEFVVLRLMDKI
jgi:hypothetical protein